MHSDLPGGGQIPFCDYTDDMPVTVKTSSLRRPRGRALPRPRPRPKVEEPWSFYAAGGLEILELAAFKTLPWLVHGFSTRAGGESVLASGERVCNLGFTEWDTRKSVLENRRMFQAALGASNLTLVPLRQLHSSLVCFFGAAPSETLRGDASLTARPGLLLGIQTADCVPILLVDPRKRAVAAVHAGWRGTLARIAEKAVGRMQLEFGSKPTNLLAALGPAIGPCCYEVGT